MDLLKDDPSVWKLWGICSQRQFYENMFKFKKALIRTGIRFIAVLDSNGIDDGENPSGYLIFWPRNRDDVDAILSLMEDYSFYRKTLCTATSALREQALEVKLCEC